MIDIIKEITSGIQGKTKEDNKSPLAFVNVSRRDVLRAGLVGFAIMAIPGSAAEAFQQYKTGGDGQDGGLKYDPNIFVSIDEDGTVTIIAHRSEMGQGSKTSLPMVLADEMGADWNKVKIVQAEGDHKKYGNQNTDGSRSLRHHIQSMRQMGASVRHMLTNAAAKKWKVSAKEITVGIHEVSHGSKKAGFGELAKEAMSLPVPKFEELKFKNEKEFRYIGKGKISSYDLHDITTGKAIYGADIMLPGMKVAVIARPPAVGEKPLKINDKAARAVKGVEDIQMLQGFIMPAKFSPLGGVAVIASNTASAIKGRDALEIEWSKGPHSDYDSKAFLKEMRKTASKSGKILRKTGDWGAAKKNAAKIFAREYSQSHFVHSPMEPPVAVARVTTEGAEIWAPLQDPDGARNDIASVLKMDVSKVKVNVTLLGGGFGRKSKSDFAQEAALLSQKIKKPVKVQWTREDDIRHSFNHTTSVERLEASIDKKGKVSGLRYISVSPSILSTFAPDAGYHLGFESGMGQVDLPFAIPNMNIENGKALAHTRIGWFRSVNNVQRAWAIQSFVAELAQDLGRDHKDMLLELIGPDRVIKQTEEGLSKDFWNYGESYKEYPIDTKRLKNVLNIAAEKAGWGKKMPKGEGIGLAVHRSFVTYVASAVHVRIDEDGTVRVPEVHTAIDCGYAANPERIRSQMEGSAVMGMTTALYSAVNYEKGAVQEGNFDSYEMVQATNYPQKVHTHIVEHPFSVHASGVGEPGLPPIPPAIVNGIYNATGKRFRHLPTGSTVKT